MSKEAIKKNKIGRRNVITDSGRFNNNFDAIKVLDFFGKTTTELKELGYQEVQITLKFTAHEINDGYQYFWIYDGNFSNSKNLHEQKFEHGKGKKDSNPKNYIYSNIIIDLDDIINNTLYIRYGASGAGEDNWANYNVSVLLILIE